MDFKSLTAKLTELSDTAAKMGIQALDQAGKFSGEMLEKTADITYEKIKTTPFCIMTPEAFDSVQSDKNLVVFVVGDKENPQTKAIIGRMPLLVGKAWKFTATVKVVYAADLPNLVQSLGASVPSACIYRDGTQKWVLTGVKLDQFLETFDIFADWNQSVEDPAMKPVDASAL